jgi:hypothetical protein
MELADMKVSAACKKEERKMDPGKLGNSTVAILTGRQGKLDTN